MRRRDGFTILRSAALLLLVGAAAAQHPSGNTPPPPQTNPAGTPGYGSQSGTPGYGAQAPEPFSAATQERLEHSRQTDRQRRLIADTDRLLLLANQLKADMDKTTKDQLSIDVIKKAEEIEKLAHSVKERMKG